MLCDLFKGNHSLLQLVVAPPPLDAECCPPVNNLEDNGNCKAPSEPPGFKGKLYLGRSCDLDHRKVEERKELLLTTFIRHSIMVQNGKTDSDYHVYLRAFEAQKILVLVLENHHVWVISALKGRS